MAKKVLVRQEGKGKARGAAKPWGDAVKYRVAGWLGVILVAAALSDYLLALYPLGLGSPEWETATIGAIVQGLPLISIGMAAIWVSAGGLGVKWLLLTVGWSLMAAAIVLFVALIVFATNIPMAIRATQDVARVGIEKLVARTLFMGLLFDAAYIVAAIVTLKWALGNSSKESLA